MSNTINDILNDVFDVANGQINVTASGSGGSDTGQRFTDADIINSAYDESNNALQVNT
jgi:hypothetical protein